MSENVGKVDQAIRLITGSVLIGSLTFNAIPAPPNNRWRYRNISYYVRILRNMYDLQFTTPKHAPRRNRQFDL